MERRNFIKRAGGAAAGFMIVPAMANSNFLSSEKTIEFSKKELKSKLDEYFTKMLNSKMNIESINPDGRYFFADAIKVDVVKEKTTVFDHAEDIIENMKKNGIDASSLRDGIIPDELTIYPGKIGFNIDGGFGMLNVPGLRNYDANITVVNQISVNCKTAPKNWRNVTNLTMEKTEKIHKFEGKSDNGIFRLWVSGNQEHAIDVDQLNPTLIFKNLRMKQYLSTDNLRGVINHDLSSQIFNV